MGKDMTFFLFVGMFQGIVSETKAFRKEKKAVAAFDGYTGEDYEKLTADEEKWHDFQQYNDKYSGSNIYELQIEP